MKETLLELVQGDCVRLTASEVLRLTADIEPVDIAEIFEELDKKQSVKLFRLLSKDIATDVFAELNPEQQEDIVKTLSDKEQAFIINDLFTDDAVDLIEEMPDKIVKRLLQNANEDTRRDINFCLRYPDNSAGSIMTTEYVELKENQTVEKVFDVIRKQGVQKETIYTCFVTNKKRELIGYVSVKDLIFASPEAKIGDIMGEGVIYVNTRDTYDQVSTVFSKYGFVSMPVVDRDKKLVGIITVDDILETIQEEHTEDIQKMVGIIPTDKPYLKTSVWGHTKSRVLWLTILAISAIFTGQIIMTFEDALLVMPILMSFIPLLMDTAGNSGSQSATTVIRGMALDEIKGKHFFRIVYKEVMIGALCGAIVGAVNYVRILIQYQDNMLGLAVFFGLIATIVIAKMLGAMLPLLARRCKMDPAVMSSPLITTIADILGLLVFFGFATILLGL